MEPQTAAVVAVVVTVCVAAIAALWKIVDQVRAISEEQSLARHNLRSEFFAHVAETEDRLTRRIERLEALSYGFNARLRDENEHRGGDE